MDLMDVIEQRRSVRRYKPDLVPEAVLTQVLEAARLAPSGGNRQPWHFIVVRDPERRKLLDVASWAQEAPLLIVGCTEAQTPTDIAIAFEHLVLAATNFGLGTCWMGRWGRDEGIKNVLNIPENVKVLAVTPLGYPAESPAAKPRKLLSEIIHTETF